MPALTDAAVDLHHPRDAHHSPCGRDSRRDRVEAAAAALRRVLRGHDLLCTNQGMAVVTPLALVDEPTRLTASDIYTRMTAAGHDLDASTV